MTDKEILEEIKNIVDKHANLKCHPRLRGKTEEGKDLYSFRIVREVQNWSMYNRSYQFSATLEEGLVELKKYLRID